MLSQGGVRADWDIWVNYTVPGCDIKHYKYLYCCASHHHTRSPLRTCKNGICHLCQGGRPHDGWQHITPFLSCFSFIWKYRPLLWGERDGVRLLWVYSAEESKHCRLERSDNNSQSVISLTLPPGPWLLAIPAWSPWLSLSLSSHDLYQAQTEKYLSISPPH